MGLNIGQISKQFNKSGYRLVSKDIGLKLPKLSFIPESATSYDKIVIEHESGIKKVIHSFKNDKGKIVYRQKTNSNSPIYEESTYEWFKPQLRTVKTKFREGKDPNAFTNHGLIENTFYIDKSQNKIIKDKYTVIDINPQTKTVTRTQATHSYAPNNNFGQTVDTSEITEISNGIKTKGIYQAFLNREHSLPNNITTRSFGLTNSEINQICNMPYFNAMLKTPKNFIFAAKPRVLFNQNVEMNLPVIISSQKQGGAAYLPQTGRIMFSQKSINKGIKSSLISTFEHEARHRWQHKLIKALEKGLLTNKEDIKMAKAFKENFNNYIRETEDFVKYEQQLLEVDAYKVTNNVLENYSKNINELSNIFTKASRKTLGE